MMRAIKFRPVFQRVALCALCGCGAPSYLEMPQKAEPPAVISATSQQIANKDVVAGSYIVAFRTELPASALGFATYLHEYQKHYDPLQENFASDHRIKNIHFIAGVNFKRPLIKK